MTVFIYFYKSACFEFFLLRDSGNKFGLYDFKKALMFIYKKLWLKIVYGLSHQVCNGLPVYTIETFKKLVTGPNKSE